jgi:hypothetical protein
MPKLSKKLEDLILEENPDLRAQGLRPKVVWVPDTTATGLDEDLRKDFEAIRNSPGEKEILDWMEKVADWPKD